MIEQLFRLFYICYRFKRYKWPYTCPALELHLNSILNRETLTVILTFLTLSLQIFQTYIFSFYGGMSTVPGLNKHMLDSFWA